MIEQAGLDTELARMLHQSRRVDVAVLQQLLAEARGARPNGHSLARLLVERGLLDANEAQAYMTHVQSGLQRVKQTRPATSRPQTQQLDSPAGTQQPKPATASGPLAGFARMLQPGTMLGDLRLLERLGSGSYGAVHLAEHVKSGKVFAVKTLLQTAGEEDVARMRREAEAQSRGSPHPNVVRVHGQGFAHGRHFLVMEYAPDGDLEERLRMAPLNPIQAVTWIRDLASGLGHMHDLKVLHRDIKPANVVFKGETPKLVDFGLARFDGAQSLTKSGDILGTPVYMSPEQASGKRKLVGPPADVYGLAAILYQALTGEYPYIGKTGLEVVQKIMRSDPARPRSIRPELDSELEAIVLRAMSRDRSERYTAGELAAALDDYLGSGADEDDDEVASREAPIPPALLIGVPVVLVLLVILAIALLSGGDPPKSKEDSTSQTPAVKSPAPSAKTVLPEQSAPERKTPERKTPEPETPERKTPERKTLTSATDPLIPERKTIVPERKTVVPERKTETPKPPVRPVDPRTAPPPPTSTLDLPAIKPPKPFAWKGKPKKYGKLRDDAHAWKWKKGKTRRYALRIDTSMAAGDMLAVSKRRFILDVTAKEVDDYEARLVATIREMAVFWQRQGRTHAFDSRANKDPKIPFNRAIGKTFEFGMDDTGELDQVDGLVGVQSIQAAIWKGVDPSLKEWYRVPELTDRAVMVRLLDALMFVVPGDRSEDDDADPLDPFELMRPASWTPSADTREVGARQSGLMGRINVMSVLETQAKLRRTSRKTSQIQWEGTSTVGGGGLFRGDRKQTGQAQVSPGYVKWSYFKDTFKARVSAMGGFDVLGQVEGQLELLKKPK